MKISDLLQEGEGGAIPRRTLESLTGLDGRSVRLLIQSERLQGVPIIGGQTGYYLAADQSERKAFARSMRHRAAEIIRAADAVERGEQPTE